MKILKALVHFDAEEVLVVESQSDSAESDISEDGCDSEENPQDCAGLQEALGEQHQEVDQEAGAVASDNEYHTTSRLDRAPLVKSIPAVPLLVQQVAAGLHDLQPPPVAAFKEAKEGKESEPADKTKKRKGNKGKKPEEPRCSYECFSVVLTVVQLLLRKVVLWVCPAGPRSHGARARPSSPAQRHVRTKTSTHSSRRSALLPWRRCQRRHEQIHTR